MTGRQSLGQYEEELSKTMVQKTNELCRNWIRENPTGGVSDPFQPWVKRLNDPHNSEFFPASVVFQEIPGKPASFFPNRSLP